MSVIFKSLFVTKITIASSCEDSSILKFSIIDTERNSYSELNVSISLGPIPCFHFVTTMLYTWEVIITNTTMSDWGWPRNGSHKWSANSNLHAFFGWTVTNKILAIW